MITRVRTEKQYNAVMKTIESLLEEATRKCGFRKLSKDEGVMLASLSKVAEDYEDKVLTLMPISGTNRRFT